MEYLIPTLIVIVIAIVIFSLLASIVRIVPQSRAYVITWLGTFRTVWDAGVHFKVPIVERIVKNVSLKEQVVDFAPARDYQGQRDHADRLGGLLPDYRPQTLYLWYRKPHVRH